MTRISHHDLALSGATLRLTLVGAGAPIVVIHGGPGESHHPLRPHVDALSNLGRQVVYYDQRGSGESPVESSFGTMDDHADDLEAIRSHLGVESLDLVTFSWGASVLGVYLARHPGRVAKTLVLSPPPLTNELRAQMGPRIGAAMARPEVAEVQQKLGAALNATDPVVRSEAEVRVGVAAFLYRSELALEMNAPIRNPEAAQAAEVSLQGTDLLGVFKAAEISGYVMHGENDPIPPESGRVVANALGVPLTVVPECGHAVFAEAPTRFFQVASSLWA